MDLKPIIKAPLFSKVVSTDARRVEFNSKNQVIIQNECKVSFVFIGDSITQMWELSAYFHSNDGLILNRGISGDATCYLAQRFEADAVQLNPKHCILHAGINDSWALAPNHAEGIAPKTCDELLKDTLSAFSQIIALCEKNKINLILCSVLPTARDWLEEAPERAIFIQTLNEQLQILCHNHHLIYVDYYTQWLELSDTTPIASLLLDGLHPNVFGYNSMAEILKTTLAKYEIQI